MTCTLSVALSAAALLLAALALSQQSVQAQVITMRPSDPNAVYLDAPQFKAKGDGIADDTQALQDAINAVKTGIQRGIVFVPEGRYRLSRPVYVWAGIRLMGYGKSRPTFVLGDNTPGYQGDAPSGPKYMLQFVSEPPRAPLAATGPTTEPFNPRRYRGPWGPPQLGPGPLPIPDGNPGCFYSAMDGINIEIGKGNPAAVGVRFHVAQHCYLANIDFVIGEGRAGIDGVGNENANLKFIGGEYGIITGSTSPSWPYLLIDSTFEGQRKGGIKTFLAGMTLVRCSFKNAPVAVEIFDRQWEALYMKDCRLENIGSSGIVITDDKPSTRVNLEDIVCINTPTFATLTPTGKQTAVADAVYKVTAYSYGLRIPEPGTTGAMKETVQIQPLASAPAPVPSDIPALPPSSQWIDVTTLGLKGDNATDNTAALKAAIEKHKVLYFPIGRYRVTDTITLKPDTVLIALHPMATQLVIADKTPSFDGEEGGPKALLETPQGGTNIVSGIGLDAGNNRRAIGCKWMAGEKSYMNDVKFVGGHGSFGVDGNRLPTYDRERGGDADPERKWDSIPYSLWITNGGGGTFKGVWTANPLARAGIAITDTSTPGRLYAVSVEHHCTVETLMRNASNWLILAHQHEEERQEGLKAIALDMENCSNITFGNVWFFRMTPDAPGPYAARIKDCTNIQIKGVRTYSPNGRTTFQNAFFDVNRNTLVPDKDIGWLTIDQK